MAGAHRLSLALVAVAACTRAPRPCDDCAPAEPSPIRIHEVMTKNDGAWIDEAGETDDWVELRNVTSAPVSLAGYVLEDAAGNNQEVPPLELAPGAVLLLWADDDPEQGALHLAFELSSRGERLTLRYPDGRRADRVTLGPSEPNLAWVRRADGTVESCRWATPGRVNTEPCAPPPPTELPQDEVFAPYTWPEPWPALPQPLALTELALRPGQLVELHNLGTSSVDLSAYAVELSPHAPGLAWPSLGLGRRLSWPAATLGAGERVVVPLTSDDVAALAATPEYEGVVTLFELASGAVVDRVDFMAWPEGAVLSRHPEHGRWRFCATSTPGAANDACAPLASRPVGTRLRHLYTPGDFAALAARGTELGMQSVKVVVDLDAGEVVHLLSNDWDLHYTFVREEIYGEPHLDRCDPDQNQEFRLGWAQFSQEQYYAVETRRFLLATLEHHTGAGLRTFELTTGDRIIAPQMQRAFFAAMGRVDTPRLWALRPQDTRQSTELRLIEGTVPIVDRNAPFRDVEEQLLAPGLAYGTLTFVPAADLESTPLGARVIVVTDEVPNDLPFVGGLVTEAFQTPLAHVNLLSKNRGTPNLALRAARSDPRFAALFGQLVRLEVQTGGFVLSAADPAEAEAYWATLAGPGEALVPRLDTSVRGPQPLAGLDLTALPAIGAKAAQLAELGRVDSARTACPGPVRVPQAAFAIPLVHSLEHYEASGARARLAELEADAAFRADPLVRHSGLAEVRALVLAQPVDAALLAEVVALATSSFGDAPLRLRSSSNTEDLPGFNGAGLYTSASASLLAGDLEDALRTVWASLYNPRAYDERAHYRVSSATVAMGVLVHPAFQKERANGVAVSRDVRDPIRGDYYYFNLQAGEASVTNPAPGITTTQLIYRWGRTPPIMVDAETNLPSSGPVMSDGEVAHAACVLRAIHDHFRPLLDPTLENRWFAMDIELKLAGEERALWVKQARPFSFGNAELPADCREF